MIMAAFSELSRAQDNKSKAADPYAFSIRVYRIPSDELTIGFVSKERGKLRAPALPGANVSNGEIEAFIKRSHDVMKEYLAQQSISLPKGSLACYDPASGTLALRAMEVVHGVVLSFADAKLNTLPAHVAWSLDILETKSAAARSAMKEAAGQSDHTAVYDHLLPQAKFVVTMRGETKSGQQSTANQGTRVDDPVEYKLDKKNRIEVARDEKQVGTRIELEPTVGADGRTLDLNVAITHRHAAGTPRWDTLTAASVEKIQARWSDYPLAQVNASLTLNSGYTKMLGLFELDGAADPERADKVRVAFIRAAAVKVQPLEDLRVEQMLKSHGESMEPTLNAVRPVADPTLPSGMIDRRFRVPPDFLSMGPTEPLTTPSTVDPFKVGAIARDEPSFVWREPAKEILRAQGIPFPPGSSANYLIGTSELVVRNTPANIDLVEAFLTPLDGHYPKMLSFSIHIVQADAVLIRRLERETFTLPDHAAAWKAIEDAVAQGKAKVLRSAWIETKSGQQHTTESVVEYVHSDGLHVTDESKAADIGKPAGTNEVKAAPNITEGVTNKPHHHLLGAASEANPVGLRIETEPTLGADGRTVDVNLNVEYDYAPPVQRIADDPPPEHTVQLDAPLTEFRKHEIKTATTMLDGSTRMISVWKPAGTPELDGDVLQAAFLRADVVPLNPPVK